MSKSNKGIKKLNRNTFDEKILHRYLFERYYFGDKKMINSLLPPRLQGKTISYVIPEQHPIDEKGYRPDLDLYFTNFEQAIPIEAKWSDRTFTEKNQIDYIKKHQGFVAAFDNELPEVAQGVEVVVIQFENFTNWVAENVSRLTREALVYKTNASELITQQKWVVFLRGTAHKNFFRMLEKSKNDPFWAFKHIPRSFKNILQMQHGDLCLFILGKAGQAISMADDSELPWSFRGFYLTQIKEPYFMALEGMKRMFFLDEKDHNKQDGEKPINRRRWPHFMDFKIIDQFTTDQSSFIPAGKCGEFIDAFVESDRGKGSPAPLTNAEWDSLKDKLNNLRGKYKDKSNK